MRVTEVEMIDPAGRVVEHGVCIVEEDAEASRLSGARVIRAHTFRSSARPEEDWPLPPMHSFLVDLGGPT